MPQGRVILKSHPNSRAPVGADEVFVPLHCTDFLHPVSPGLLQSLPTGVMRHIPVNPLCKSR